MKLIESRSNKMSLSALCIVCNKCLLIDWSLESFFSCKEAALEFKCVCGLSFWGWVFKGQPLANRHFELNLNSISQYSYLSSSQEPSECLLNVKDPCYHTSISVPGVWNVKDPSSEEECLLSGFWFWRRSQICYKCSDRRQVLVLACSRVIMKTALALAVSVLEYIIVKLWVISSLLLTRTKFINLCEDPEIGFVFGWSTNHQRIL